MTYVRQVPPRTDDSGLLTAVRVLEALPDLLMAAKTQRGLTWQQVADQVGVSVPTCHHVAKRQRKITTGVAVNMLKWLASLTETR